MLPEQQQRILGYFIEEAKDHLNTIEQGLLSLQQTIDDPEMLREVYRAAHSVKGGAGMLGLHSIQKTAHLLEDCFKILEESPVRVDQKLEALFLRVFDTLQSLIEQLQGPFGLTEDVASSLMSTVEPVFTELEQYLDVLVKQPTVGGQATPTAAAAQQKEQLQVAFKQEVMEVLRQMLQLFKPPQWPNSQPQLQDCCDQLRQLGDRFDLASWCSFMEMVKNAIAYPENTAQTLAPVVIKDIKQAQELVLAGRATEISPSEQLQALQPPVPLVASTPEPDLADLLEITGESNDEADWFSSNLDSASADLEDTEDTPLLALDFDSEPEAPEFWETDTTTPDLEMPAAAQQPVGNEELAGTTPADPTGPEVGVAELNSLADLFDEALDLDSTWQQEEVVSDASDEALPDLLSDFGAEDSNEFADLFEDDSEPLTAPNLLEDDDTLTLFGEAFLDEESTSDWQAPSLNETDASSDLIDLFQDAAEEPTAANLEEDEDFSLFGNFLDEDTSEAVATIEEAEFPTTETPQTSAPGADNLSELFAGLEEDDLSWDRVSQEPDSSVSDVNLLLEDDTVDSELFSIEAEPMTLEASGSAESLANLATESEDSWLENWDSEAIAASDFDRQTLTASGGNKTENEWSDLSNFAPEADPSLDLSASQLDDFSDLLGNPQTEQDSNLSTDEWDSLALGSLEPEAADIAVGAPDSQGRSDLDVSDLEAMDLSWTEPTSLDSSAEPAGFMDDFDTSTLFSESAAESGLSDLFNVPETTAQNPASKAPAGNESIEDFFSLDWEQESEFWSQEESQPSTEQPLESVLEDNWLEASSGSEPEELQNFALADIDLGLEDSAETFDLGFASDASVDLFADAPLTETDFAADFLAEEPEALTSNDGLGELADAPLDADLMADSDAALDFEWDLAADEETRGSNLSVEAGEEPGLELEELDLFGEEASDGAELPQEVSAIAEDSESENWFESAGDEAVDWLSSLTEEDTPELSENLTQADEPVSEPLELTDTSTTPTFDGLEEFDELEALLGEEVGASEEDSPANQTDDWADLEAMLNDDAVGLPNVSAAAKAPVKSVTAKTSPSSASTSAPLGKAVDDEFAELEKMVEEAVQGGSPVKPRQGSVASTKRGPRPFEQTMKVPVKHLDNLTNLVGELVVNRNSLEQDQDRLRQCLDNLLNRVQQLSEVGARMQDLYERSLLEASLLASRRSYSSTSIYERSSPERHSTGLDFDPTELDRFTKFHEHAQDMIELIVRVRESTSDIEFIVDETEQVSRQFRQVSTQLSEGLTRARMVPFAEIERVFPLARYVRDKAAELGKQAELRVEGRETLIDKLILENLSDPLKHLINNAIAHGIETPEVRKAAGKSPVGRIVLHAFHQGNQTVISFSDDGAGIDVEKVKAKAIEKGLITRAEARTLSRPEVYELLYHSGFTTQDKKNLIAGAGVGMDVVRTNVSEIRGTITTDSTLGKGTSFIIRLPLTLSICKALRCVSDKARIAFPMDGVEDALDISKERIQMNAEGQPCIPWRDTMLPFKPLSELLTYHRQLGRGSVYGANKEEEAISIVVLRSAGNILAIQVDQVLGEQEIVIKQLEGPIPKPVGIAGATVLGDGRIMPIADVLELIDLAMGRLRREPGTWDGRSVSAVPEQQPVMEPTVLIVDDSITVRELLSMTFNKAGYRVEQARDGQEAWDKLKSGLPCDIVFCDIEMPRMDGLELLSRLHKDTDLTHLPVAMLTSRGAEKHRQMALELGASGYFTKPYLEEALLDAASRMLKGEKLVASNTST